MLSKVVQILIILLCLLALAVPSPAQSQAGETPTPSAATPLAEAFISTEADPTSLAIGETALVSVRLNNVPVEGYKSAEFTCTYDGALVEKSNIAVGDLFGTEPVVAVHDPQAGIFIVAIAGTNSNRAMTSGTAFTFNVIGLHAGQPALQCTARLSKGDNLAIDVPSIGADLTILEADVSPTPFVPATAAPGGHQHPTAEGPVPESPTPLPTSSLSGQILASKPVTVHLFDANHVEVVSIVANPDGTFTLTPLPGDYILVATASGFLSLQGSVTITAGNPTVFPAASLVAGDVDGNHVIDQFDALTIGMSYTASTPEAADLNNDAVIDFLDLELLAENYRQTGPTGNSSPILGLLEKIKPTAVSSLIPGPIKTVIAPAPTGSPIPGPKEPVIAATTTTRTTGTTGPGGPFPDAPLCPTHDPTRWHGLWDSARGCHYDHEHGTLPFTPEVVAAFPGFDLRALLCGIEIGHCIPSGPMEHTHKHGGFKWNVLVGHPHGCEGHEGSTIGIDASAIEYHAFGDYAVEFGTRIHSALAMMRQCKLENPTDYGYIFVDQHVDYGQRVSGYQGVVLPYSDNPLPSYPSGAAPYFTLDCIYCGNKADTRQDILDTGSNTSSTWTSDPRELVGSGSHLFEILFRVRDTYQVLDRRDLEYPFTFVWLCSNDEGLTHAAQAGCRYNNSTTAIHEVNGTIPAEWDNLAGFDANPAIGRITADGYVTHFGQLNLSCAAAGTDCHPIKLVNAFVGYYGSFLLAEKEDQFTPVGAPERDIYFCAGVPCSETGPGAVSSGWIGPEN